MLKRPLILSSFETLLTGLQTIGLPRAGQAHLLSLGIPKLLVHRTKFPAWHVVNSSQFLFGKLLTLQRHDRVGLHKGSIKQLINTHIVTMKLCPRRGRLLGWAYTWKRNWILHRGSNPVRNWQVHKFPLAETRKSQMSGKEVTSISVETN